MSFLTHGFQIRYIKIAFESLGYKRQKTQDLVPMFVLCDSNLSFPLSHTLSQTFIPKCYHFHTELRQWNHVKRYMQKETESGFRNVFRNLDFPCGPVVKNLSARAGDSGSIPGSGRFTGGGNRIHSSILAWTIPWTEEPGGLPSMGSKELDITSDQA